MKITARGKYVLVEVDPEKSRVSKSGLITPDNVEQERKSTGKVVNVGKKVEDIKVGDRVVFGTYAGDSLKMETRDYKLILEEDILAFIK